VRITERIDLPVAPERAWRAIVDPRVVRRALPGLESLEVVGGGPLRRGTRIRAVLRIGAAQLGSELEVTELVEGRDFVISGVTGIDLHLGLRVRPHDEGTRIVVRFGYNPPGGVTGALAARLAGPEMHRRMRVMLRRVGRVLLGEPEPAPLPSPLRVATLAVRGGGILRRAGVLRPMRPDKYAVVARRLARWGATPAGAYAAAAARDPQRLAIVDGDRALTYAELDVRSTALAVALRDRGVAEGHRVAVLARNHRGFVEALVAISKTGGDAVLLDPGLERERLATLLERERPTLVVADADLLDALDAAIPDRVVRVASAWDEEHEARHGVRALDELVVEGAERPLPLPAGPGRVELLTAGATGAPKGMRRNRIPADAPIALLDRLPFRDGDTVLVLPPLAHAWGFANLVVTLLLGGTVVLDRSFEPVEALRTIARHRVDALVATPAMLEELLAVPEDERDRYDRSSLRTTAVSGASLPAAVATAWMATYGPELFSVYGSVEAGWATVADPADLRAAPATAGRSTIGATVRIYDPHGAPLPTHRVGLILVGGATLPDRYTDGSPVPRIDDLVRTGDVGWLDDLGRLFVLGREDEVDVELGARPPLALVATG
jgi:fatty-acyl-CoA synthase